MKSNTMLKPYAVSRYYEVTPSSARANMTDAKSRAEITETKARFARRIKALRDARGWSQETLARYAGGRVSAKTVSNAERYGRETGGKEVEFTVDSAEQIAHALGLEGWMLLAPFPDSLGEVDGDPAGFRRLTKIFKRILYKCAEDPDFCHRVSAMLLDRYSSA